MKKLLFLFLLCFLSFLSKADMGPKPTKKFSLYFHTQNSENIKNVYLLICKDENCQSFDTLQELGPQGITFDQKECRAMAYSFSPKNVLLIELENKTLRSNVFGGKAFNSKYNAIITDEGIEIKETTSWFYFDGKLYVFFRALVLTLFIELIVALFYLKAKKIRLKNLKFIIYVNLISLPLFWFGIFELIENFIVAFIVGEIFVLLLEWLLLSIFLRNNTKPEVENNIENATHYLTKSELFYLTFSMNISSLLIGGVISLFLYFS